MRMNAGRVKGGKWLALVVLLALALAGWLWQKPPEGAKAQMEPKSQAPMSPEAYQVMQNEVRLRAQWPDKRLPGEEILKQYGAAGTRPEDDLHAMAHAFSNLMLLVKGGSPFHLGANEEFAAALLGKNAAHEVFLAAGHPCLNAASQLVDRWGTPLFFHARDASRIDIRSAGPDRVMWTADDLQRQHEGQIVRGPGLPELNK